MSIFYKNKKSFCIEYISNKQKYLISVKAFSEEDAFKRFDKLWNDEVKGIYPYQIYEIVSIKRIYKKIQF